MKTKAKDLQEGMVVDLEPLGKKVVGQRNWEYVQYGYVSVEGINGGWLDAEAQPGEVVIYSTGTLSLPVIVSGEAEIEVFEETE